MHFGTRLRVLYVLGLLAAATSLSPAAIVAADPPARDLPGPEIGDEAKDFEATTLDGEPFKLSEAAADGRVVLVFLRGYPGYQCPVCATQVGDFRKAAERFEKTKAKVVFLYPGAPEGLEERAKEFLGEKPLPDNVRFLTDPDLVVTKSYGLHWDAPNETAYPSTFVIDADRKIRHAKVSTTHGGRAKASEVLALLERPSSR